MITTKIKSGKAEIISNGTVISFRGQPIQIEFEDVLKNTIRIVFEFKDDKTKEDTPYTNATADGLNLKIELFNFNNPLGSGSSAPLQIGNFEGKPMFLNYRVYKIGKNVTTDKTLQYSIYVLEEAK